MMKPLEGLKVIELATFVAGPTCARALADWGAEVIKIESPKGDPLRRVGNNTKCPTLPEENPCYDLSNIGKKNLALNLKSAEGMEVMDKLLKTSDIFITNNRTKALEKMGLSYELIKEKYPHIIFAQVLGYGEQGPLKDKPGFDFTAFYARGGFLGTLYEKGTSPLNPVPQVGDNAVAMNLAGGILAALYRKQKTGLGDKITVSIYQTAIFMFNLVVTGSQYGFSYPVSRKAVANPFLNTYRTKDDRWLQICCPEYDRMFSVIMQAVGREDLVGSEKYATVKSIAGHTTEVIEILEAQFAQKTADEWLVIFEQCDVPCEKALLWDEIAKDEQAWANDYLYKMHYPNGNDRTLVELPVKFASIGKPEHQPGAAIGEHNAEILKELGYSSEKINQLLADKVIVGE